MCLSLTLNEVLPPLKVYGKGSYFPISAKKKSIYRKNVIQKNKFYYAKEIKLNNKIIKIEKSLKFIVYFA